MVIIGFVAGYLESIVLRAIVNPGDQGVFQFVVADCLFDHLMHAVGGNTIMVRGQRIGNVQDQSGSQGGFIGITRGNKIHIITGSTFWW